MAEIVKMPKLSDTMTEGVVAEWHKKVGEFVESGELLAEIETDKATMEFESFQEGTLLHIGVQKGGTAPVDSILAILGEKGEDISALLNQTAAPAAVVAEAKIEAPFVVAAPVASNGALEELKQKASGIKAEIVRMPKLSDTMTEGVVAAWHKNVGDSVNSGELLAEIETDKATMEFESFQDGVLLYKGVEQGGSAPVDSILAILGEKGADFNTLIELEKLASSTASTPKIEAPVVENKKESVVVEQKVAANNAAPAANNKAAKAPAVVGKVMASPLARKLAEDRKLPLHLIPGSGDHGRIVKRDVDNFVVGGSLHNAQENFSEAPVSQMRKVIAKRLSESLFTAPHFYLTLEIDMDNAIGARKALIEADGAKISFNDMVIKACAKALKKHPVINSSWLGDKIRTNEHVHIGVAMAVEEGLLVPVVRFADQKSLADISSTVKEYAGRAKDKKLTPEDWAGNTFTISNLGMFGIEEFTAIINPPDACILAVGGIKQVPVVKNGIVVPGNIMKVTLSCDHRVVDGATGAAFLQTVKNNLENPVLLF